MLLACRFLKHKSFCTHSQQLIITSLACDPKNVFHCQFPLEFSDNFEIGKRVTWLPVDEQTRQTTHRQPTTTLEFVVAEVIARGDELNQKQADVEAERDATLKARSFGG